LIFIVIGATDIGAGAIREIGTGDVRSAGMIDHMFRAAIIRAARGVGSIGGGDTGAGTTTIWSAIGGTNLLGGVGRACGNRGFFRLFD
jgi:hypothetical protein